jgi:hypothetical protein
MQIDNLQEYKGKVPDMRRQYLSVSFGTMRIRIFGLNLRA